MISIIVPFRNSEAYIEQCIRSVLNQSFLDWELLLIDDGSNDKSNEICSSYAMHDDRIILFEGVCGGVSAARNKGLKFAKGEYVCFVDSDDWLEDDALKVMVAEIDNADLLCASYRKVNDNEVKKYDFADACLDVESFVTALFNSRKAYQGYCWGKLYSRSIIQNNGIQFDEHLAYNEDRLFVLQYAIKCREIRTSSIVVYNYRIHNGSAMNLAMSDKTVLDSQIKNELLSANAVSKELNGRYIEAEGWLEYNLLKKIYLWQKQLDRNSFIYKTVTAKRKLIEKKVWSNKKIALFTRLKLIKSLIK